MSFILQDSSTALWQVSVTDSGILQTTSVGSGTPITLTLNDNGAGSTSWIVGVTTLGILTTTSTASGSHPTTKAILSGTGNTTWNLEVLSSGILQTVETSGQSISGNVGVAGATITFTGPSSGSVTADGAGNFVITGLSNGTYTITPSLGGYSFTPSLRIVTVSSANVTGVNFTATASAGGSLRPWFGPKLAACMRGVRG